MKYVKGNSSSAMRWMWISLPVLALATPSLWAESVSSNFRLISSAPASTSALAVSPLHRFYVVGGSGQPVGISASTNASVVAGGTSAQLPTDRLFLGRFEN